MPDLSPDEQPNEDAPRRRDPLAAATVVFAILGLSTLAIAQPLLDLLGRNAGFFVAHDTTAAGLLAFVVGITLVGPLVAAGIVLATKAVYRPAGAVVLSTCIGFLSAVAVLVVFKKSFESAVPGWGALAIAVAAGVAATVLYWRSTHVRWALKFAAIAAPAAALLFLFGTPANRILFPAETTQSLDVGDATPPIVMVLFDEFPVATLLDRDGAIDAEAFPNLAAFANKSMFFNNATTAHTHTMEAVPSVVSGVRTKPEALPTVGDHPTSIHALLAEEYRLNVVEPITALCPPSECKDKRPPAVRRAKAFTRDLLAVTAVMAVPTGVGIELPPLDQGWRDFQAPKDKPVTRDRFLNRGRRMRDQKATIFTRFIEGIGPADEPTLHFLHTILPHHPWVHLPDGRTYAEPPLKGPGMQGFPGMRSGRWTKRPWPVQQAYQRHILQVQYVDRLVGQLLTRLEKQGLYDDALIVLTSDHGVSFVPGEPLRDVSPANVAHISGIPLFVKLPGQTEGETIARPVQNLDVVPTILDVLGADPPAELDGRSLLDDGGQLVKRSVDSPYEVPPLVLHRFERRLAEVVANKYDLFGAGGTIDPFRLAPEGTADLLGRRAAAGQPAALTRSIALDDPGAFDDVNLQAPDVPILVTGDVSTQGSEPPTLAVAVNGTVAAITVAEPAERKGERPFQALIPHRLLRDGRNELEVFEVDAGGQLLAVTTP